MASERKQWKTCEERLVQQLRQLQQQNAPTALPSGNMKPVEQTGNGYRYKQAVNEVQLPQSDSVEAAKGYQQSLQVNRVQTDGVEAAKDYQQ